MKTPWVKPSENSVPYRITFREWISLVRRARYTQVPFRIIAAELVLAIIVVSIAFGLLFALVKLSSGRLRDVNPQLLSVGVILYLIGIIVFLSKISGTLSKRLRSKFPGCSNPEYFEGAFWVKDDCLVCTANEVETRVPWHRVDRITHIEKKNVIMFWVMPFAYVLKTKSLKSSEIEDILTDCRQKIENAKARQLTQKSSQNQEQDYE